ncbi:MAG: hypothetical protein IJ591_01535 [Lachnospiraceae bacterium]|nr:hypothetical protein [Lachnospiraceae bacterium]
MSITLYGVKAEGKMSKKYILYGAGRQGMEALQKYGKDRVAYFCDGFCDAKEINGISLIRPSELAKLCDGNDYTVVITPKIEKVREEIIAGLEKEGIPYLIYGKTDNGAYGTKTFRICGTADDPKFQIDEEETKGYNWRVKPTVGMFRAMFKKYADDFAGRPLDLTIFVGDHVLDAYEQMQAQGLSHIFAYSTIHAYSDEVIAIPDYRCCFDPLEYPFDETPAKCAEVAATKWTDNRIAWRGTIASNDERKWLDQLASKHPDKLLVEDPSWEANQVYFPMTELAKFKYTLDIRGYGWTDRIKVLMQLGRPVFIVDRPYSEWYFDKLVPMEHFVPVKEDLSDLIERYDHLEVHPEEYDRIVNGAAKFVKENFSPEAILKSLKEVVYAFTC